MTAQSKSKGRRRGLRAAWLAVVALVSLVVILYRSTIMQGYFFPVRIVGSSMVGTFYGEHIVVVCPECGIKHRVEPQPMQRQAAAAEFTCPNCLGSVDLKTGELVPAERVLIDKRELRSRAPSRLDVVAARDPDDGKLVIKRVLGLPTESITNSSLSPFSDGRQVELMASAELGGMLTLVSDDRFRRNNESRWNDIRSSWQQTTHGHAIEAPLTSTQWLTYTHSNYRPGTEPHVIYDECAFNNSLSRPLSPSRYVVATGRAVVEGRGDFVLRCAIDDQSFEFRYDLFNSTHDLNGGGETPFSEREFAFGIHVGFGNVPVRHVAWRSLSIEGLYNRDENAGWSRPVFDWRVEFESGSF